MTDLVWKNSALDDTNTPVRRLGGWLACSLFFLMLSFPTMSRVLYAKESLVALLVFLIGIRALTARLQLDRTVVLWTLFMVAISLLFGIRGLFLGAPGALLQMQVYAAWPLLYLVLLSGINGRVLRGLDRTLVFAGAFIAVYVVIFVFSELSLVPKIHLFDWMLTPEEDQFGVIQSVGFGEGFVQVYVVGTGSLAFIVPFMLSAIALRGQSQKGPWLARKWLMASLFLDLPVLVFSGLRALQLVFMLAPFLTLGLGIFLPKAERRSLVKWLGLATVALVILAIVLIPLLSLLHTTSFEAMADRFTSGFDFSASNRSDNAVGRVEQYFALMRGWREAPFIGNGLGASAHTSIRAPKRPWSYELTYIDLLFQIGLVGFVVYAAGILWIYWTGIKIVRRGGSDSRFVLPALVGLTGLLIANGVDPYLRSFDTLWPIFLPLAFINCWLLTSQATKIAHPRNASAYRSPD